MSENTIQQIKNAEEEAKKIIEQAKTQVENSILEAEKNGEKSLADAKNQITPQIEEIIQNAKKEIQKIRVEQEQDLNERINQLDSIDSKKISQASDLVFKQIVK